MWLRSTKREETGAGDDFESWQSIQKRGVDLGVGADHQATDFWGERSELGGIDFRMHHAASFLQPRLGTGIQVFGSDHEGPFIG